MKGAANPREAPPMQVDGLQQAFTQNRPRLLRFFTARTGNVADAEDVVQEIWIRTINAATGPIGNPVAYLHRVGMNVVLEHVRSGRRRTAREAAYSDRGGSFAGPEPIDDAPSAHMVLEGRERLERLAAILSGPPEGAMQVFRRHRIDGASHAQIAAEKGITHSAIEKHIAVALKHIRKGMADASE